MDQASRITQMTSVPRQLGTVALTSLVVFSRPFRLSFSLDSEAAQ